MARESSAGHRRYSRSKARSEHKGSDESDEDYMFDENECDESEDEYSSYVGDESEESLGEYKDDEEDEEEELRRKKVKKIVRQRAPQRKRNRAVKPRKRKRVSYKEEDDEDDDNDDENDEDFKPDEALALDDDEIELPITKGNKNLSRTRVHGIFKGEEDDIDGVNDEDDELPTVKGNKKLGNPRLHKGIAEGEGGGGGGGEEEVEVEEEDDDDDDDEEFTLDEVDGADDEEDELPMMKGNMKLGKTRLHKGIAKGEEDDDEFLPNEVGEVDGADDEEEELPMMKGNMKLGKTQLHKGIATGEEDDDEFLPDELDEVDGIDDEFLPDEVDEVDGIDDEDESPMMIGNGKLSKTRLQKSIAKGEEDDDEFLPDEVDEVDGIDDEDGSPMTVGNGKLGKTRLQKSIAKEDEYDDDYEFTPDEVDFDDEEDELALTKGSKKLRKTWLHKGISKGKQSKTSSQIPDTMTRAKGRTKCGVKRKERVDENGRLNGINTVDENNKILVEGRRKRRKIVHSDSDSMSSRPSNFEYTVSEEEREQVREASEFCSGSTASWRSPVISKNLIEKETPQVQKKRSRRKDKEKVEEWKTEAGKQVCGICLSEEGKRRVRGTLNCCSHYFCFACIMEWSKVESRCPLCKQRFVTISKPTKSNTCFDMRTAVIQVPERDQVYQPSEEELRGYLDPYENVICTECQQGGDDALMLLCDLCDSPAHTYCVGLGREVPEGNWYCEGCRPTALGSLDQQNLNHTPDEHRTSNFSIRSPPATNVRETFDLNEMYIPEAPLTQEASHVPSPRIGQAASPASGSVAFTVSDRRRIQRQINQLILNNRIRQVDNRTTGVMNSVTGNYLFGSQIGQIRELAPQPVVTAPHIPFLHGRRLQDSISGLPISRNAFAATSSHLNGQCIQNQPSTSVQSSFSGLLQGEFGAINSDSGSGLVHQQLHPCSNRPNIMPDASTSHYQYREVSPLNGEKHQATVPSRTWHGGYTHHFS